MGSLDLGPATNWMGQLMGKVGEETEPGTEVESP